MMTITIPRWTPLALALAAFVGFWVLALTNSLPFPQGQQHRPIEQTTKCSTHDCREDVAADALVFYTEILAFFTAALAIVSAVQGCFLYRADKTAQTSIELAKTNAETAQSLAFSQIDEARQNRILQYRPKLHVRNIVINQPVFTKGHPVSGQFYVSNIGGARAFVTESHCIVLWNTNGLPMKRPYEGDDGNNPVPAFEITAGGSQVGQFNGPGLFPLDGPLGQEQSPRIYVMGWIEYVDDIPIKRRTAFCRKFVQRDGPARFYAVEDPDYEHEE